MSKYAKAMAAIAKPENEALNWLLGVMLRNQAGERGSHFMLDALENPRTPYLVCWNYWIEQYRAALINPEDAPRKVAFCDANNAPVVCLPWLAVPPFRSGRIVCEDCMCAFERFCKNLEEICALLEHLFIRFTIFGFGMYGFYQMIAVHVRGRACP